MPKVRAAAGRNSTEPLEQLTGTAWLRRVVNDESASELRRDRAAIALANIENRRDLKPGKKEVALNRAKWSGYGSEWWHLLRTPEERRQLEAELDADPELRRAVEADAAEARAKQREMDAGRVPRPAQTDTTNWDRYLRDEGEQPPKPVPKRTIDDVLAEREQRISKLDQADWGDDLASRPSPFAVPGERNPPPVDDE